MDEDISIDDTESMNKTFIAKIVINGQPNMYSPVEQGITKLSDAMLANEYQTTVEQAKDKISAKRTPDFSQVAPISENDISDKGLYQSKDDLGTSYYYRGKVRNNFVKFAGYYWRIIRKNGDDSVRLIYNGDKPGQTGTHTRIGESVFNTLGDNPGYVGYMYGNVLNTSYEQTYANENSSTIKTFLEDWYQTNIYDKGYHQYVADEIFCNDRSVTIGNGYTSSSSYYGAFNRLSQRKAPTLICPQDNDKFTTTESTLGNKALTYPIGLITADELAMAGAVNGKNNVLFHLYSGNYDWTMSPYSFIAGNTNEWLFNCNGGFVYWGRVYSEYSVRPVINLKADVEITGGIGTANDPFTVS